MNFTRIGFLCTCNYHYQLADKYFICALKFAASKCYCCWGYYCSQPLFILFLGGWIISFRNNIMVKIMSLVTVLPKKKKVLPLSMVSYERMLRSGRRSEKGTEVCLSEEK